MSKVDEQIIEAANMMVEGLKDLRFYISSAFDERAAKTKSEYVSDCSAVIYTLLAIKDKRHE